MNSKMKKRYIIISVLVVLFSLVVSLGQAAGDKGDTPLPEDEVTRISCAYGDEGLGPGWIGRQRHRISCAYGDETYHYDLYIPQGYHADTSSRFPALFIASPGGNATMGNAEGWIRSHGWLAVMLVEAQNGPPEINDENFICAYDDVTQRVRVHDNMLFATGISGAARMSARFVTYRPGFRGLILQAAGMCSDYNDCAFIEWFLGTKPNLLTFATFGDTDFNLWELDHLIATIPAERFNHEIFAGGHEGAPVETMNWAFAWLMANTLEEEYVISGKIGSATYDLLSDITVSSSSGSSTNTGAPDIYHWEGGYTHYSLSVIGAGTYTITASKEGYVFTPAPLLISVPPEAWDQDFEIRFDFDISGQVLDGSGNPFAGVEISAGSEYTATSGMDGEIPLPDSRLVPTRLHLPFWATLSGPLPGLSPCPWTPLTRISPS